MDGRSIQEMHAGQVPQLKCGDLREKKLSANRGALPAYGEHLDKTRWLNRWIPRTGMIIGSLLLIGCCTIWFISYSRELAFDGFLGGRSWILIVVGDGHLVLFLRSFDASWTDETIHKEVMDVRWTIGLFDSRETGSRFGDAYRLPKYEWSGLWNWQASRVFVDLSRRGSMCSCDLGTPVWVPVSLIVGLFAARACQIRLRLRARRKRCLCLMCSYDLRGSLSECCPECGRKRS